MKRHHLILALILISTGLGSPSRTSAQDLPEEFAQFKEDLKNCNPNTHILPSLLDLFGLNLIHRANILGYRGESCAINYSFATPEEPNLQAIYLRCVFPPDKVAQLIASLDSDVRGTVDISDECETDENWMDKLNL